MKWSDDQEDNESGDILIDGRYGISMDGMRIVSKDYLSHGDDVSPHYIGSPSPEDTDKKCPHCDRYYDPINTGEYDTEKQLKRNVTGVVETCENKRQCAAEVLIKIKDMPPREALIYIARSYLQLKLEDMQEIFRLDASGISRAANRADEALWGKSYKNRTTQKRGQCNRP